MKFDEAVERNKIEKKLKPFPPKKYKKNGELKLFVVVKFLIIV